MNIKFIFHAQKLVLAIAFLAIALRGQAADQVVTDLGDSLGASQLRQKTTDS